MEYDVFETQNDNDPLTLFLTEAEKKPSESKEKNLMDGQKDTFLMSFLTELIHFIKNNLASIKNSALVAIDKAEDLEFKRVSHRSVTEDIKKIDSVLNTLLNYININTPIVKSNTLYVTFEEILEANEKQLRNKKIRILKKYEKDLPETYIHDEQVRFILNSVFQYAMLSVPVDGTIEVLIKCFDFQNGVDGKMISPKRNEGFIEVIVGFVGDKKQAKPLESVSESQAAQKEDTNHLILQLARDILEKNRGTMTFELDEKKPRALITLRFPIDRRKVVYYEPISI
jgi:nitrogen-specific signal transduction histidine kinase